MTKPARHIRAGGLPPTEILPTEAELDEDFRKFQRGVMKAYAAALALGLAAAIYFLI